MPVPPAAFTVPGWIRLLACALPAAVTVPGWRTTHARALRAAFVARRHHPLGLLRDLKTWHLRVDYTLVTLPTRVLAAMLFIHPCTRVRGTLPSWRRARGLLAISHQMDFSMGSLSVLRTNSNLIHYHTALPTCKVLSTRVRC